jgi:uncharacterized protein YecE (DUF72 family)
MAPDRPVVRIGTSGWHYPRGHGAWTGVVYPAARDGRRVDELSWYAERFDTVEVNVSFYRPLAAAMTRGWVKRTPPGFEFAVKLHHAFTHAGGLGRSAPARVSPVPVLEGHELGQLRQGLAPLAEAGRLGPLLAQFPPSFHASPEAAAYVAWLLEQLHDHRVAVELRHRSWSDRRADTLRLLDAAGATWTLIDEPKFPSSVYQRVDVVRDELPDRAWTYVRLHGRNAAEWWDPAEAEDRYRYLYTEDELEPFAEIAEAARALGRKLYLYTNNHFGGQAVANAAQLRQRIGQPVRGRFPRSFTARFPHLHGVVEADDEGLLF